MGIQGELNLHRLGELVELDFDNNSTIKMKIMNRIFFFYRSNSLYVNLKRDIDIIINVDSKIIEVLPSSPCHAQKQHKDNVVV